MTLGFSSAALWFLYLCEGALPSYTAAVQERSQPCIHIVGSFAIFGTMAKEVERIVSPLCSDGIVVVIDYNNNEDY